MTAETGCYVCEGHIEQSVKGQRDARGQQSKNDVAVYRQIRHLSIPPPRLRCAFDKKHACKASLQAGYTHLLCALALNLRLTGKLYGIARDRTCNDILI